jgi:hypothetical protein
MSETSKRCLAQIPLTVILAAACATPLQKAASRGEDDRVAALLAQGAQVNETSAQGMTPLMWAAIAGSETSVKVLLAKGADVNAKDKWGRSALWHAGSQEPVLRLLLEHGADANAVDRWSRTALWNAAMRGRLDTVRLLHEHGADVTIREAGGQDAEQAAFGNGFFETASYLRDATAVSKKDLTSVMEQAVDLARLGGPPQKTKKTSDVDLPKRRLAVRPDDFAIIVGVERYRALPDADYALRDAEAVRKHVQAIGFPPQNIVYLTGPNATRSALTGYLNEWLPRNVKANSNVLFYFSGHGTPDVTSGEAYIVPWDGDPRFLTSSGYATKQLYADLAKLPAKRSLVVLDACFSGNGGRSVLPKGARPLVAQVAQGFDFKNLVLLSAAGAGEITGTDDEQGHGIFTYYFLKGLSGAAADANGSVTAEGLYWYLKPLVHDQANRQNREQTPTIAGASREESIVSWPAGTP